MVTRRSALESLAAGPLGVAMGAALPAVPVLAAPSMTKLRPATRATGPEGERRADLGNGWYRNPIMPGDYADPAILKDGEDYYMTHSSFDAAPGLIIWHSRDLVNWRPVGPALEKPLGTVFAVDIAKHNGRYYIYIPFMKAPWAKDLHSFANIYVIHADSMAGPWSDPVDLKIYGLIDPGHVVGEDGKRYLYLSGVNRVALADDGLSTIGPVEPAYDGWHYPDEWVTEGYSLEGPKLFRRGEWFYLVSAVGGTAGPATSHMVIIARSKSAKGPWVNCPHNPIVRTHSDKEAWWSRGHATMIEGPKGAWYMVYHGYEKDYRSLGRQTLLEPLAWDADGWPRALGGDLSLAMPMPTGRAGAHGGFTRSDDFTRPAFGTRWSFYGAAPGEQRRAKVGANSSGQGVLTLEAKGTGPADCSPLTQTVGDHAYEISVIVDVAPGAQGGLLLFYDDRLFLGMGIDGQSMISWRGGRASYWQEPAPKVSKLHLKIVNDRQIVTFYYSVDGKNWTRHGVRSEVSGYQANTVDDLSSLRPALYASGKGAVRFTDYRFRAMG
ncbi:xylan 1,4-beta-xylosidase [Novosphingobium sp. SG751A]|uniref:family 43 glycosylhydrolase n=1 Tax=Novosphingobium sp. SG751A TaxID=2587000 RepID=UPI001554DB13|nr:family 43 glycosylhydrolase [Novosphingobium sp. SG751A]NOW48376.1 xylan 1,4-beta-xylosidase [Novosphingobium sp. SG751A]